MYLISVFLVCWCGQSISKLPYRLHALKIFVNCSFYICPRTVKCTSYLTGIFHASVRKWTQSMLQVYVRTIETLNGCIQHHCQTLLVLCVSDSMLPKHICQVVNKLTSLNSIICRWNICSMSFKSAFCCSEVDETARWISAWISLSNIRLPEVTIYYLIFVAAFACNVNLLSWVMKDYIAFGWKEPFY